jgi:hypothetical protein
VSLRSLTLLMGLVDFMGLFGLMNLRVTGGSYGCSWVSSVFVVVLIIQE